MSWLSIIFYVILNLPKFISIIRQIIDIINGLPKDQQSFWKEKLSNAVEHHKKTGDDSELKKVCEGIGCPSGLIQE